MKFKQYYTRRRFMDNNKNPVMTNEKIERSKYVKFLLFSAIGIAMFLIPVSKDGNITVLSAFISDSIISFAGDYLMWFAVWITALCGVMSLWTSIFKPKCIMKHELLKSWFYTSPLYYISRAAGGVFAVMCAYNAGPEFIIGEATGQTILGIAKPLVAVLLSIIFFVPFLTDYGLMEYIGVFLRKIIRPLFTLPGRSAINLITSWFGASNAAVIITNLQYEKGYYTKRETAVIITAFSAVNIPFCLVIFETVDAASYFVQGYATICIAGIILAMITPRIWPLRTMPNVYAKGKEKAKVNEEIVPEGMKPHRYALKLATDKTEDFSIKKIIVDGTKLLIGIYLATFPIVFAWGILACSLVEYTPIFEWVSYPFGFFMDVLGVENAFEAAPTAIVGFIDMFIPALLAINIPSIATRWMIAVLSLVQIIFMTEVGVLAMQTDAGLNVKNLLIIFLERTIIAIPIIVLAAHFVFA